MYSRSQALTQFEIEWWHNNVHMYAPESPQSSCRLRVVYPVSPVSLFDLDWLKKKWIIHCLDRFQWGFFSSSGEFLIYSSHILTISLFTSAFWGIFVVLLADIADSPIKIIIYFWMRMIWFWVKTWKCNFWEFRNWNQDLKVFKQRKSWSCSPKDINMLLLASAVAKWVMRVCLEKEFSAFIPTTTIPCHFYMVLNIWIVFLC